MGPETAETTTDSTDDVQMSDVTTEHAELRTRGKRIKKTKKHEDWQNYSAKKILLRVDMRDVY